MGSRNIIALVVILVLLLLAGWWYVNSQKAVFPAMTETQTPEQVTSEPSPTEESTQSAMQNESSPSAKIDITDKAITPKTVTIKVGETVSWTNSGKEDHQINSAVHPTHLVYPPLNTVGLLKPGDTKSLAFPDKGTYKFHDHLNPSMGGAVVVE